MNELTQAFNKLNQKLNENQELVERNAANATKAQFLQGICRRFNKDGKKEKHYTYLV